MTTKRKKASKQRPSKLELIDKFTKSIGASGLHINNSEDNVNVQQLSINEFEKLFGDQLADREKYQDSDFKLNKQGELREFISHQYKNNAENTPSWDDLTKLYETNMKSIADTVSAINELRNNEAFLSSLTEQESDKLTILIRTAGSDITMSLKELEEIHNSYYDKSGLVIEKDIMDYLYIGNQYGIWHEKYLTLTEQVMVEIISISRDMEERHNAFLMNNADTIMDMLKNKVNSITDVVDVKAEQVDRGLTPSVLLSDESPYIDVSENEVKNEDK